MWLPLFSKFHSMFNQDSEVKSTKIGVQLPEKGSEVQQTAGRIEAKIMASKPPIKALCTKQDMCVLVHGGGGHTPDDRMPAKIDCVKKSAIAGFRVLKQGGTSIEAVEAAIRVMEDDPIMNAGYGSCLNIEGNVEMDASIMCGKTFSAGGVACVKDIKNPISLAKLVMEETPHALLSGEGAEKFAEDNNFPRVPPGSLVTPFRKEELESFKQNMKDELGIIDVETVGAVAIDRGGRLAAGTSTGGFVGKMPGSVGDSPQIGKGAYCDDDVAAVSSTGHGESIMKFCLPMRIFTEIQLGKNAKEATTITLKQMKDRLHGEAGAICITKDGDIGIFCTTPKMAWAYQRGEQIHYGKNGNESFTEESIVKGN
ncbi:hypothetical protein HHI36_021202 [Cryptolaemus montrouzieri]|uniref:Asparaginase n=1 Tax=Cryptolaemus montrouzieri TaxID=559131 RepID=A0ABD2MW94_9CUCU